MRKFENCDIFSVLGTIVAHNTKHYQTDFDIDKDILTEAAEENTVSDRRYLWMSRPCGTHCLKEKDVFLRDTSEYNTWTAYETGADEIVAYAIQVNGYEDGVLKGNLYELDYASHCAMVKDSAVYIAQVKLHCPDRDVIMAYSDDWRQRAREYDYDYREFIPLSPNKHQSLLEKMQKERQAETYYPWDEEKLKLEHGEKSAFSIYQLKCENYDKLFMDYERTKEKGFSVKANDYELVYIAENDGYSLDDIYEKFNLNHPPDFRGHSLSVSDVVVYSDKEGVGAYFVDRCGCVELKDFFETAQKKPAQM